MKRLLILITFLLSQEVGDECILYNGEIGFLECNLVCYPISLLENIGNGSCDDGIDCCELNCPEFSCDGGDCIGTYYESYCELYEECSNGDMNSDNEINVQDLLLMVNCILEYNCEDCSDLNQNNTTNVIDVLILVDIILNPQETVMDVDGNIYQTVEIGNQLWMSENLKVTHFNNGDAITYIENDGHWGSLDEGQYGVYDDELTNTDIYGNLYNWLAVDDIRGICPEGWHIPSYEEFIQLTDFIAPEGIESWGNSAAGGKLKETGLEHWNYFSDQISLEASNESGFTGLPAGYRNTNSGDYINIGFDGYFWSSTEHSSELAWRLYLFYYSSGCAQDVFGKPNGFSIRCLKD
tara:strand:+ start:722 stop:1777 length:1056 start_codon:yes stop_codon:yes gene_type:complete